MSNLTRKRYRGFNIEYYQDEYEVWRATCFLTIKSEHRVFPNSKFMLSTGGTEQKLLETISQKIDEWYLAELHDYEMDLAVAQDILSAFKQHIEGVKNEQLN